MSFFNPFSYNWSHVNEDIYGHLKAFAQDSPYNAALIANIPYLGDYARANEQGEYLNDYITGRSLRWSDVKYPFGSAVSSLPEFSSQIQGLGYRFKTRFSRSHSRRNRKKPYRKYSRRWRRY